MKTCTITVVMTLFTKCGPPCLTGIFSHLRSKLRSSGCQLKSPNRELYNCTTKTLHTELKMPDPSVLHLSVLSVLMSGLLLVLLPRLLLPKLSHSLRTKSLLLFEDHVSSHLIRALSHCSFSRDLHGRKWYKMENSSGVRSYIQW